MAEPDFRRPGTHPSGSFRPANTTAPDTDDVVYIETVMAQAQSHLTGHDGAGVLRRNQACLACRRRKLKCDAQRPHCSTCVRSYNHILKTSPRNNPVLTCDYDDSEDQELALAASEAGEEEDGAKKKKRKATGEGRKKKIADEETEAERLRKKIEDLELQLKQKDVPMKPWAAPPVPVTTKTWLSAQNPSSPTAFLEMLSSAASAQAPESSVSGFRSDGAQNAMASGVFSAPWPKEQQSTGLTPFLNNEDWQPEPVGNDPEPSRRSSIKTPDILATADKFGFPGVNMKDPLLNSQWQHPEAANLSSADPGAQEVQSEIRLDGSFDLGLEAGFDDAMQQQLLMDLFWPGWPPNLPEPHVVNDLVEAFFDLVPNLTRVLHRARFLARLALPPTHSNFPHPSLIHAICSSAAAWCTPSVYEKSSKGAAFDLGLKFEPTPESSSFGLRQAAYAKESIQEGLNTGNRLFDVVRGMIILCRVFIDDTRMLECWSYCGLVARMILPLGLNVRSAELSLKSVMLPPPMDALEREERRAAMWMAFYHDTVASAASGWGTSISLEELTVPLPVSAKEFEIGSDYMESNPQDLESPDIWTRHPVVDSFVMCSKASVIMNRVSRFIRRWKNRHLREEDDLEGMQKPEFRELGNAIACFQMSFPPSLRNPCNLSPKRKLDIDLISAHLLPYAATICLYEPFCDVTDPHDAGSRRVLAAAQGIVSIVQQLASSINDGGQNFTAIMHSSASVCLVTAARTILAYYRCALNNADSAAAESHRMDIELIRMALGQFGLRFKIGHHHSQLIEYFLDRCTNPTLEKLIAHYPEHPRLGAPDLNENANLGVCVLNALNIKRGYWRIKPHDMSPFGSTPDSVGHASSNARASSSSSGAGRHSDFPLCTHHIKPTSANPNRQLDNSITSSPTSISPDFGARLSDYTQGTSANRSVEEVQNVMDVDKRKGSADEGFGLTSALIEKIGDNRDLRADGTTGGFTTVNLGGVAVSWQ